MDGRGRALDNVFIERLRRSVKYELIYRGDFTSAPNSGRRWISISIITISTAPLAYFDGTHLYLLRSQSVASAVDTYRARPWCVTSL